MDVDACGIAAPVFDAGGNAVAALDIAAVAQRFAAAKKELRDHVCAHAARISERLRDTPTLGVINR